MKLILIATLAILLSACSMYRSEFDCPPCKGIGCKSVSDVMDMIVEREEKMDLFVPDADDAKFLREGRKK